MEGAESRSGVRAQKVQVLLWAVGKSLYFCWPAQCVHPSPPKYRRFDSEFRKMSSKAE